MVSTKLIRPLLCIVFPSRAKVPREVARFHGMASVGDASYQITVDHGLVRAKFDSSPNWKVLGTVVKLVDASVRDHADASKITGRELETLRAQMRKPLLESTELTVPGSSEWSGKFAIYEPQTE